MAVFCALLVTSNQFSDLDVAGDILAISLLGFSFIAYLSFDSQVGWRIIDFAWVAASFAAIAVALINISDGARRERLFQAYTQFSQAFSDLIYAAQSTVTNECEDLPTRADLSRRSPEPYEGACDRIKHLLPQMEYQYNRFSTSQDGASLNEWGNDIRIPNTAPKGSWVGLYDSSARFSDAIRIFNTARSQNQPENGKLLNLVAQHKFEILVLFHGVFRWSADIENYG